MMSLSVVTIIELADFVAVVGWIVSVAVVFGSDVRAFGQLAQELA